MQKNITIKARYILLFSKKGIGEMKFNEKLITLRKSKKLSQEDLANELGVARQTISKWELGETTPEMDKLIKISEIFKISLDDLVKEELEADIIRSDSNHSNTQKLAGLTIMILKGICIFFIVAFLIITIIVITSFVSFNNFKSNSHVTVEKTQDNVVIHE